MSDLVSLRPAGDSDRAFVGDLSARVFGHFGAYDGWLPTLIGDPKLRTVIAVSGGGRAGFAIHTAPPPTPRIVVELLAIAVEPDRQTRGIGRFLLQDVECEARRNGASLVRLTVAEENRPARRLFEASGYVAVEGMGGRYAGGQRSIDLVKRLPSSRRFAVDPTDRPPFPVDAIVVEDDTYFVLGAEPVIRMPTEHPVRVWTAAHEQQPVVPGTVHARGGRPARLHAVVHDVSLDPTWNEEWIRSALDETWKLAATNGFGAIALPVLGAVHGRLEAARFVAILVESLRGTSPRAPERIWIVADGEQRETVASLLD